MVKLVAEGTIEIVIQHPVVGDAVYAGLHSEWRIKMDLHNIRELANVDDEKGRMVVFEDVLTVDELETVKPLVVEKL